MITQEEARENMRQSMAAIREALRKLLQDDVDVEAVVFGYTVKGDENVHAMGAGDELDSKLCVAAIGALWGSAGVVQVES